MPPSDDRVGPMYYRAVSYVERMIADTGVSQKEISLDTGIAESNFSQKKRGGRSHFYEDEFHAIAEFFRRKTGRPLIGFPHVEWEMMLACDRKVGGWVQRTH